MKIFSDIRLMIKWIPLIKDIKKALKHFLIIVDDLKLLVRQDSQVLGASYHEDVVVFEDCYGKSKKRFALLKIAVCLQNGSTAEYVENIVFGMINYLCVKKVLEFRFLRMTESKSMPRCITNYWQNVREIKSSKLEEEITHFYFYCPLV